MCRHEWIEKQTRHTDNKLSWWSVNVSIRIKIACHGNGMFAEYLLLGNILVCSSTLPCDCKWIRNQKPLRFAIIQQWLPMPSHMWHTYSIAHFCYTKKLMQKQTIHSIFHFIRCSFWVLNIVVVQKSMQLMCCTSSYYVDFYQSKVLM